MTPATSSAPGSTGQTQLNKHIKFKPHWHYPASAIGDTQAPLRSREIIGRLTKGATNNGGIYVSQFYGTTIYGYPHKNTANNPPECSISGNEAVNDIAVDGKGNLMVPDGEARAIYVYQGPGMCGSEVGSPISDPYGQPSDAASADAVNGTIAVGNIFDSSGAGSISICTMSAGCTQNLTNPNMYEVAGVAMDNSGNCWASATNSAGTATLTYFAGCTGSGQAATGYMNTYYGGLDIDKNGNIVSISAFDNNVYVYSGCNPACTLVGGPYTLTNEAVFGHLNKQSMTFAVGAFGNGSADVYYYSPSALTYWYSITNGLSASLDTEGVAYNPRSEQ
jgi:hypothetical protein